MCKTQISKPQEVVKRSDEGLCGILSPQMRGYPLFPAQERRVT